MNNNSYDEYKARMSHGEPLYKKRNLYKVYYRHFKSRSFTSKKAALQFCSNNGITEMAIYKLYESNNKIDLYKLAQVETSLSF